MLLTREQLAPIVVDVAYSGESHAGSPDEYKHAEFSTWESNCVKKIK